MSVYEDYSDCNELKDVLEVLIVDTLVIPPHKFHGIINKWVDKRYDYRSTRSRRSIKSNLIDAYISDIISWKRFCLFLRVLDIKYITLSIELPSESSYISVTKRLGVINDVGVRATIVDYSDGSILSDIINGVDREYITVSIATRAKRNYNINTLSVLRNPNNLKQSIDSEAITWGKFLDILDVSDLLPTKIKFIFEFANGTNVEDIIILERPI